MKILNRRARYNYIIEETFEAGIVLTGAEVKMIRAGRADLSESHVMIRPDRALLVNAYIPVYAFAKVPGYDSHRSRMLLLHRHQLLHLLGKQMERHRMVIPLSCYFRNNLVKVELGLGRGKKQYEKREELRKKAIQRDIEQELRGKE